MLFLLIVDVPNRHVDELHLSSQTPLSVFYLLLRLSVLLVLLATLPLGSLLRRCSLGPRPLRAEDAGEKTLHRLMLQQQQQLVLLLLESPANQTAHQQQWRHQRMRLLQRC